jgi:hypothetical protein
MKPAALGFRVHSGWAALVALSLEEDQPRILARQRPELVETFTYEFRQPYHTAEKMPLEKARAFLSRIEAEAERLAEEVVRSAQTKLRKQSCQLTHCALLLASAKPLPTLAKILSSHALIHTADGELFRQALIRASERCHVALFTLKERELFGVASKVLRLDPAALKSRLAACGKLMGPPWSQDEKFGALAAWLALRSANGNL